jgi:hypothetical protein
MGKSWRILLKNSALGLRQIFRIFVLRGESAPGCCVDGSRSRQGENSSARRDPLVSKLHDTTPRATDFSFGLPNRVFQQNWREAAIRAAGESTAQFHGGRAVTLTNSSGQGAKEHSNVIRQKVRLLHRGEVTACR